jgi:signal transduction histidine kinase
MTQLLNDVLVLGKAEAGKLEFNPQPLDLEQFCLNLTDELNLDASNQHNLTFVNHAQAIQANLDEKLLRHILNNLLSNAIKYSPSGSDVKFELSCQDTQAIFRIQDEGIGIPEEDQQRLFESFHRAKNVGNVPGTGLGLAIVKNAIDLHGGKISVNSQVGMGTTFTVAIPLNQEQ